MGLGRIDKLQLLTRTCTKPTQGGQCIVGALLVLGRIMGNLNSQDSPRPGLGGIHHLPPYNILCASPRGHIKMVFCPETPQWESCLEILKLGTPTTLGPHNFLFRPLIEMRSTAKLQPSSRGFQWYVACHLQKRKSGQFSTFNGQESNYQFDSQLFI